MTSASPNARRKSFSTFTPVSVRSAEGVMLENVTEAAGSCLPILPLNARAVLPVSLYAEVSRLHLLPVKSFAGQRRVVGMCDGRVRVDMPTGHVDAHRYRFAGPAQWKV